MFWKTSVGNWVLVAKLLVGETVGMGVGPSFCELDGSGSGGTETTAYENVLVAGSFSLLSVGRNEQCGPLAGCTYKLVCSVISIGDGFKQSIHAVAYIAPATGCWACICPTCDCLGA